MRYVSIFVFGSSSLLVLLLSPCAMGLIGSIVMSLQVRNGGDANRRNHKSTPTRTSNGIGSTICPRYFERLGTMAEGAKDLGNIFQVNGRLPELSSDIQHG